LTAACSFSGLKDVNVPTPAIGIVPPASFLVLPPARLVVRSRERSPGDASGCPARQPAPARSAR
jgi:hypothetical protein